MADLTVTQEDLSDAVTFLEQFLTTSLSAYDFSEGTANRDIAINSVAYTVAFVRKEIANVKNRQSLLKLSEISEDDSADEVVDEILSDWFITRKTGRKSRGYITLKFSRQDIGVVSFTQEDTFTKNGLAFNITQEVEVIQTSNLVLNTDNLGIEFYTTTLLIEAAEVGDSYDVDPGQFTEFPKISPFLTSAYNLEKFSGGKGVETSEELVVRSETAITVRDLNTIPGIKTVLAEGFSQVLEVYPIGMGDPEMQRDLIELTRGSGDPVKIHRGSMMDIYVKFPVEFDLSYADSFPESGGLEVANYTVNDVAITAIKLPTYPFYKIRAVVDTSVDPVVEVPYSVVVEDQNLWNSDRQGIYLVVGNAFLGSFLDVYYDTVTGYGDVNTYVKEERQRIVVADPILKAAFPLYLNFEMKYYPAASAITDLTAAKKLLQSFIHGRVMGKDFKISEIIDTFVKAYPGNVVQLPQLVVGELLLPNGAVLPLTFTDRIRVPVKYYYDELTPEVLVPLFDGDADPSDKIIVVLADLQVSIRTTRFVVRTTDIAINSI